MGVKEDCSDVVGLYPVWPDGTCNYLVFDFDNHNDSSVSIKWQEEALFVAFQADKKSNIESNNANVALFVAFWTDTKSNIFAFFLMPPSIRKTRHPPKIKGCINAALALITCSNLHIRDEFVFDVHAYDAGVIDFAVLGEEDLERVAVAHLEKVERAVAVDRRGVAGDHASCAAYNCA